MADQIVGRFARQIRIEQIYRRKIPRQLTSTALRFVPISHRGIFRLFKVKSVGFELADQLIDSIDVANITVKPFDGFIFLCGGRIGAPSDELASARHYLTLKLDIQNHTILGRKVLIAEKMTNLLSEGDFQNLLEFEASISALCSCIIIFLESAGSIAELGSFAVMPQISPKLLVFCEQMHVSGESPSFIYLGPLASLKKQNRSSVQVFPMSENRGDSLVASNGLMNDCWVDIEGAIRQSISRSVPESQFDVGSLAHKMLLMVAVAGLCICVTVPELKECLGVFRVEISARELNRTLRMLEHFGLINKYEYGSQDFYFPAEDHSLFVFRSIKGGRKIFDALRFKSVAHEIYTRTDDKKVRAIKAFRKRSS